MPFGSGYNAQVIAPPAALLAGALLAGFLLDLIWPIGFMPAGYSLPVGFALIFLAVNLMTFAAREMIRIKTTLSIANAGDRPRDGRRLCVEPQSDLSRHGLAVRRRCCFHQFLVDSLFSPWPLRRSCKKASSNPKKPISNGDSGNDIWPTKPASGAGSEGRVRALRSKRSRLSVPGAEKGETMQDKPSGGPDVIALPPLILGAAIALGLILNFFWPAKILGRRRGRAAWRSHCSWRRRHRSLGRSGDALRRTRPFDVRKAPTRIVTSGIFFRKAAIRFTSAWFCSALASLSSPIRSGCLVLSRCWRPSCKKA